MVAPRSQIQSAVGPEEPDQEAMLRAIVERLAPFEPERIVLFGSRARGEAREGSDYDLLVVLPAIDDPREAAIALQRALKDLPISKDVFVSSREAWSRAGEARSLIADEAATRGRVIFERR